MAPPCGPRAARHPSPHDTSDYGSSEGTHVQQCVRCLHYGHDRCRRKPRCFRCGSFEHVDPTTCTLPVTCLNCGGSHHSRYAGCPSRLRELTIQQLVHKQGLSRKEAVQIAASFGVDTSASTSTCSSVPPRSPTTAAAAAATTTATTATATTTTTGTAVAAAATHVTVARAVTLCDEKQQNNKTKEDVNATATNRSIAVQTEPPPADVATQTDHPYTPPASETSGPQLVNCWTYPTYPTYQCYPVQMVPVVNAGGYSPVAAAAAVASTGSISSSLPISGVFSGSQVHFNCSAQPPPATDYYTSIASYTSY